MKEFIKKATNAKLLFCVTIIFILSSLATGLLIDYFIDFSQGRLTAAIFAGIFLAIIIIYLVISYAYKIIISLKKTYAEKGNLFTLYRKDTVFRTSVNKSISCIYILNNAFVNFSVSFANHKWYFLSVSAIFFLVFIMQLYLIGNLGDSKKKQNTVIAWLIIFMAIACLGIVILLAYNQTAFTSKGLIIYWDALYVFVVFISAVVGATKAIKRNDHVIGRFLAVKLANAIFGLFTLTVTMLMTFSEDYYQFRLVSIIVGISAFVLIIAVAIAQLVLSKAYEKKFVEPNI